ncbi:S-methyl-5-thioribose-1-phosphate isomerase [Eggerthellaceae bacterium 24-137]
MSLHLENLPRTIYVERVAGEALAEPGREAFADTVAPQVAMIDQRALPGELEWIRTDDWRQVVDAVKALAVRGAPAIGVAGAAAVMLAAFELADDCGLVLVAGARATAGDEAVPGDGMDGSVSTALFAARLRKAAAVVAAARPTAVNLSWAVSKALETASEALKAGATPRQVAEGLYELTEALIAEDEAANRAIGAHGAALLRDLSRAKGHSLNLLTHCNAGSLATAFYGTALGVVYAAAEEGLVERVYADETRPVGQGARLTVWELAQAGVPATLICDNMAASLMAAGRIDAVVVGADRIAANGDTANKIGTLGVAVLAHHFGIPFFVAAPESTRDVACATGAGIPIEERDGAEVLAQPISGVEVFNPAFDVTPGALIDAIITEKGIWRP